MTFHFQIRKISAMQWMQALGYCQDLYNIFCDPLQSFTWVSWGYLPSTDILWRPQFCHFLPFLCCYVFSKWNIFLYFSLFRSYSFLSLSFPVQSSFFYPSALSILEYPKLSLSPFCLFLLVFYFLCSCLLSPLIFFIYHHLLPIVCTPLLSAGAAGLNLLPNFQKGGGGAWHDLNFERGLLEKKGAFFRFGVQFYKMRTKIWNISWQKEFLNNTIFFSHNFEFKLGNFI